MRHTKVWCLLGWHWRVVRQRCTLCAAPSTLSTWLSLNYSIIHIKALSARELVQRGLKSRETSSPKRPQEWTVQLRPWKPRQEVRESYAKGQCRCIQEILRITKDLVGKVVIWHMTQFKSCLNLAFELDFSHIPWNSYSHQLFTVLVWQ